MMGYHITRLYINDSTALKIIATSAPITLSQVDCLHVCMESARSWFDIVLRLPLHTYTSFTFFTLGRGLRCLNTLLRLSTFENAGWDRKEAAPPSTLIGILDRLIANMEQALLLAGFDEEGAAAPSVFEMFVKPFRACRANCISQLGVAGIADPNSGRPVDGLSGGDGLPTPQNSVDDNIAGLWDDLATTNDWWMDLLDQQYT
jgi:hypothetical protein